MGCHVISDHRFPICGLGLSQFWPSRDQALNGEVLSCTIHFRHFCSLLHFHTSSLLSSSKFFLLLISAIPIILKSHHPLFMFQNHSPFTCLPYIAISTFQTVPDSLCRSVPYSDSVFVPDLSFVIAPLPLVYKPLYNLGVDHS